MTPREERGLIIAAVCKLNRTYEGWLVPSQSANEKIYRVDVEKQSCTCPDHAEGYKCKHIFAVEYTIKRECRPDGTFIETKTMTLTSKKTYAQDWKAYNLAQTTEKKRFQVLLRELVRNVPNLPKPKSGPAPHLGSDSVFSMAYKVYSTFSSRRFHCDLQDAHERGHLSCPISGMKVNHFMENDFFTPILHNLIVQASLPLRSVETHFSPDSSGFSTSRFVRWYDEKYGVHRSGKEWVKAHICTGVKTNVVTAVVIGDKDAADCPQFPELIGTTAKNFTIDKVSADKAYLSHQNLELSESLGATPFIPFKINSTDGGGDGAWGRMWHYFLFRQEEFQKHYHLRSNVESTMSMVKAKFRDHVRSKTDVAMKNEVLCKFLCHNICCCISAQCELGIEPVFWPEEPSQRATILPMQ
jgi:transposase